MRIFVAGATGVLGRRVVPRLIARKHDVRAVARSALKAAALKEMGARPVRLDLFDATAVRTALAGQEVVINLATSVPEGSKAMFRRSWATNDRIRSEASENLVEGAIAGGARRFIQESITFTYPHRGDEWIDETTPVEAAWYTASALDAERAAARFTESGGVGVVLRFALFYGPDSSFILDIMNFVRRGLAPAFGGDGFISSISTVDAAAAVVAALDVKAGIYNIGDDDPVRRRDYYATLATTLGVKPPYMLPRWVGRLMGSVGETLSRSQRVSNRKFREATKWAPRWASVRQGLPAVVEAVARAGTHSLAPAESSH